jgi:hypothetical protein
MSIAHDSVEPARRQTRRTIVKGAAWSVPVLAVGTPAAHAGISQCTVTGSVTLGPTGRVRLDAVCRDLSQSGAFAVPRIRNNYGLVWLPPYIEICNCTSDPAWYRFRETDSLDNFQIEVNGQHNDQNGPGAGYRDPFKLAAVGDAGGCQRFSLTYRTSDPRPFSDVANGIPPSGSRDAVTVNLILQRHPSTAAVAPGPNDPGWALNTDLPFDGFVWRTTTPEPNFDSCAAGQVAPRSLSTERSTPSLGD